MPIKAAIKKLFPDQVNGYRLYRDLVLNRDSYLHSTGWLKSVENNRPMSPKGDPVPWMNYTIVRFLEKRIPKNALMYEYGSGASTLFWAKRISRVVSLEYEESWYEKIRREMPSNATVEFCAQDRDGQYCRNITKHNLKFDIIVVDGRDRVNCVKRAVENLSPQGVVLLDDSDREKYIPAFDFMRISGYKALSLAGLKPTGLGSDETTIFYKSENCLEI